MVRRLPFPALQSRPAHRSVLGLSVACSLSGSSRNVPAAPAPGEAIEPALATPLKGTQKPGESADRVVPPDQDHPRAPDYPGN